MDISKKEVAHLYLSEKPNMSTENLNRSSKLGKVETQPLVNGVIPPPVTISRQESPRSQGLFRKLSQKMTRRSQPAIFNPASTTPKGDSIAGEDWGEPDEKGNDARALYRQSRRMSKALFHNQDNFENFHHSSQMVFNEQIEFDVKIFLKQLAYHLLEPASLPCVLRYEGIAMAKNLGMLPTRTRVLHFWHSRLVLYGFIFIPIILWARWDCQQQMGYISICITLILFILKQISISARYGYMNNIHYSKHRTKVLTSNEAEGYTLTGWLKQDSDTVEREMIGAMHRLKLHTVGGLYFAFLPQQKFKVCKVCLIEDAQSSDSIMSAFVIRTGEPEAKKTLLQRNLSFDSPALAAKVRRASQQMEGQTVLLQIDEDQRQECEEESPLMASAEKESNDVVTRTPVELKSPIRPQHQKEGPDNPASRTEAHRRNSPDIPGKVKLKDTESKEAVPPKQRDEGSVLPSEINHDTAKHHHDANKHQRHEEPTPSITESDSEPNSGTRLVDVDKGSSNTSKRHGNKIVPDVLDHRPSPRDFDKQSRRRSESAKPTQPVHVTSQDPRVASNQEPLLCLNIEQVIRTLICRQEAKSSTKSLEAMALCLAWLQSILVPAVCAVNITDYYVLIPLLLFALGHVSLRYHLLMNMVSAYCDLRRRDWILSHIGKIMDSGLLVDSPQPQAENIFMWLTMRRIAIEFGQPFQKRVMMLTSTLVIFAWFCLVWLLLLILIVFGQNTPLIHSIRTESLIIILLDSVVIYGGLFAITIMGNKVNRKDSGHQAAINRQMIRVQMRILNWHPTLPKARSLLHKMEILERVLKSVGDAVLTEGEYYKIKVLGTVTSEAVYIGILVLWGLTVVLAIVLSL